MKQYIYTVISRRTGKVVCSGSSKECAEVLGCDAGTIRGMVDRYPHYSSYFLGRFKVTRKEKQTTYRNKFYTIKNGEDIVVR